MTDASAGKSGIGVLVVDALNARAATFYRGYGFRATKDSAPTLYLPLGTGSERQD